MKGRRSFTFFLFYLIFTCLILANLAASGSPRNLKNLLKSQENFYLSEIPKIDCHEHFMAGGDVEIYFQSMKDSNIEKVVLFPTGRAPNNVGYEKNMAELLRLAKTYPDKIIPFATVDETNANAAGVLEQVVHPKFHAWDWSS